MIAFLRGTILQKGQNFVILEAGNIGYQVFVNATICAELERGGAAEFFIHHHISDTAQDLYGFRNFSELEFFKMLISVSGVGPKSALGVLATAAVEDVKTAIAHGDASLLKKVSGIGTKTAERIVLELRHKVGNLPLAAGDAASSLVSGGASDEIDALISLGYSAMQAREALRGVDSAVTDSSERIRLALRGLGR